MNQDQTTFSNAGEISQNNLEEEEDIFVSRQLYNVVIIISLSLGLADPRDVLSIAIYILRLHAMY